MARLPQPGSDDGVWGAILNDFLSQSHAADGSLKADLTLRGTTTVERDINIGGQVFGGRVSVKQINGNYQLSAGDFAFGVLEIFSPSPVTITIPSGLNLAEGSIIEICQSGIGQVTIAPGSSAVTLHSAASLKLRTQWSSVTLRCRRGNEWIVSGDTE